MYIHQLTFTLTLEHIFSNELRLEIRDSQFFAYFTPQGFLGRLAIVQMTTYGRVPFTRLNILPRWSFLQIHVALCIEYVQMHHGMKQS